MQVAPVVLPARWDKMDPVKLQSVPGTGISPENRVKEMSFSHHRMWLQHLQLQDLLQPLTEFLQNHLCFLPPAKSIKSDKTSKIRENKPEKSFILKGRIWFIKKDNIDTDMIFHNRYLAITDINEMGQYTFDNLKGYEDFSTKAKPGDIIIAGKNFGSGSSRQQAVDCFLSLGVQCIVAESFGAIYERNAINAALPVITCNSLNILELKDGDNVEINLKTGKILNLSNNKNTSASPFSEVQFEIYQNGGLLN